jgi:hypothetical protein
MGVFPGDAKGRSFFVYGPHREAFAGPTTAGAEIVPSARPAGQQLGQASDGRAEEPDRHVLQVSRPGGRRDDQAYHRDQHQEPADEIRPLPVRRHRDPSPIDGQSPGYSL